MLRSPTPTEITAVRDAAGWSQAECAKLLGIGLRTLNRYESDPARQMSGAMWAYMRHVAGVERIPFRGRAA